MINIWSFVTTLVLAYAAIELGAIAQNASRSASTAPPVCTLGAPAACKDKFNYHPSLNACLNGVGTEAVNFTTWLTACPEGSHGLTILSPEFEAALREVAAAQNPPISSIWLDLRVEGTGSTLTWYGTLPYTKNSYNNFTTAVSPGGHNQKTCVHWSYAEGWKLGDCTSSTEEHRIFCLQTRASAPTIPVFNTMGTDFKTLTKAGTKVKVTCEAVVSHQDLLFILKKGDNITALSKKAPGVTGTQEFKLVDGECIRTAKLTWARTLSKADDGLMLACASAYPHKALPCRSINPYCKTLGEIKIGDPGKGSGDIQELIIIVAGGGVLFLLLLILIITVVCKKSKKKKLSEPPVPEPAPEPEPAQDVALDEEAKPEEGAEDQPAGEQAEGENPDGVPRQSTVSKSSAKTKSESGSDGGKSAAAPKKKSTAEA